MKLSTFASAMKEIVLTGIAALTLFAFAAATEASAAQAAEEQVLAEKIVLVTQLENDVLAARKVLAKSHREFEAGNLSTEEIFFITLTYEEIEASLLSSRVQLLAAMANYDAHINNSSNENETNVLAIAKHY